MFFKKLTEETVVDDNGAPNVGDLEWTIIGPYTLHISIHLSNIHSAQPSAKHTKCWPAI